MQNSEREVALVDVDNDTASKRLAEAPDIGNVSDAVLQYAVCDEFTTFSAKYALRDGTDVVIAFFPSSSFRNLVEMPEPSKGDADYSMKVLILEQLEGRCRSEWDKKMRDFWLATFPNVLSTVAQRHFEAAYPRLQAKYTDELKSWWVRAQGFGHVLDLDRFMGSFFMQLDRALDSQGN